eukprot:gene2529-2770_t
MTSAAAAAAAAAGDREIVRKDGRSDLKFHFPANQQQTETPSFYTTFTVSDDLTSIGYLTCGSDGSSFGCYGAGSLGPFSRACAYSSDPDHLYVIDSLDSVNTLYIFLYDKIYGRSLSLQSTVSLPNLSSNATSKCFLVNSGNFVYFSTDASNYYTQYDTSKGAVKNLSVCYKNTTSITTDGTVVVISSEGCYGVYGSDGWLTLSGGAISPVTTADRDGYSLV